MPYKLRLMTQVARDSVKGIVVAIASGKNNNAEFHDFYVWGDNFILPDRVPFSDLAVFDAGFDIRVCLLDEPGERSGMGRASRPELDMTHELTGSLQQAVGIRQRCA